jgi:hypothetical protein
LHYCIGAYPTINLQKVRQPLIHNPRRPLLALRRHPNPTDQGSISPPSGADHCYTPFIVPTYGDNHLVDACRGVHLVEGAGRSSLCHRAHHTKVSLAICGYKCVYFLVHLASDGGLYPPVGSCRGWAIRLARLVCLTRLTDHPHCPCLLQLHPRISLGRVLRYSATITMPKTETTGSSFARIHVKDLIRPVCLF